MKFFNIDLHIAVIEDLKRIFKSLGSDIDSVNMSGHAFVFDRKPGWNDVVNQTNWQQLNPAMCEAFYNKHKNQLDKYDGFIVTYPPAFSLLFEKFNKPIIVYVPIRYETPFPPKPHLLQWFNNFLRKGIDDKKITIIANSLYDKKHCEYFLQRECKYIPNWCDYDGQYPKWTGTESRFLLYNDSKVQLHGPLIQDRHQLKKPFTWQLVESFKGIIHIPYNVSTMSLYEQYTANTPLLFPTQRLLIEFLEQGTDVLCGLTWNQYFHLPPPTGDNPNNYKDMNVMRDWIKYAEYYNEESMPHIIYFDSLNQLNGLLKGNIDFLEVSNDMKAHNLNKKEKIYNNWKEILKIYE
jgi:hypothetical protein